MIELIRPLGTRKSNFIPPEEAMRRLDEIVVDAPPTESGVKSSAVGKYTRIESANYASGVDALRYDGLVPFSFKDNLVARLEQPELYDTWLDSDAGIAYKAESTKIKIIHNCELLRNIPADFKDAFISVDYDSLVGVEIDASKIKCNTGLSRTEIIKHPVWLELVEGDVKLLENYTDTTFSAFAAKYGATDKLMGFYKIDSPAEDQLRAPFVGSLYSNSDIVGGNVLVSRGSFLRR